MLGCCWFVRWVVVNDRRLVTGCYACVGREPGKGRERRQYKDGDEDGDKGDNEGERESVCEQAPKSTRREENRTKIR